MIEPCIHAGSEGAFRCTRLIKAIENMLPIIQ